MSSLLVGLVLVCQLNMGQCRVMPHLGPFKDPVACRQAVAAQAEQVRDELTKNSAEGLWGIFSLCTDQFNRGPRL